MTAETGSAHIAAPRLGALAILVGLAAIVGARLLLLGIWADGLAVGTAFGLALAALWVVAASPDIVRGRLIPALRGPGATRQLGLAAVAGVGFGLALVAVAIVGASVGGSPIVPGLGRPAAPLLPWAAITFVVAAAEEGILRGVLFDRLRDAGGLVPTIAITTIAFALMHVPVYGWHVVPLDLAVGLGLAGLRLTTGRVVAPLAAHVTADLATWWM